MPSYLVNALGNIIRIKDAVYIYADLGRDGEHSCYVGFINLKTGDLYNNDCIHRENGEIRFTLEDICARLALSPEQITIVSESLQSLITKGKLHSKKETTTRYQQFISQEDCWFDFLGDVDSISDDYNWRFESPGHHSVIFTTLNESIHQFFIAKRIHSSTATEPTEREDGGIVEVMKFTIQMDRIVEIYGRRRGEPRKRFI
jgi:hypothetical protein